VYIPKLRVKYSIPKAYSGENVYEKQNDEVFDVEKYDNKFILGIESSFDDAAACLVGSNG